ncbi:ClbS/DfsB family four-helix bundle protein [Alcaligenes ammonioxydans]|uniref:ClbS/DfsB family four-helix bundle protein n=1 Tax=Alcaligenes ammonioxydans TaxID=2582914 RepID=UPI001F056195|nr:ClbS/DfsB family four-helix bundle protein [Alcaligenes ammonioxydans]MCH1878422.1 ClbS/DfsB family four-helix bundle protein [Alcaligenes ammonioxydans]
MAVPQNKQELLQAISSSYQQLRAELLTVPEERCRERSLQGHVKGTQMSVSDLVAYLIGWNELVLKWSHAKARGEAVDFPERGFKWNELWALAQKFYADYADLSYSELLTRLQDVYGRIVELVGHCTDQALYGAPWYKTYSQGRMIQFNTASPYANARNRLRQWKKANSLA